MRSNIIAVLLSFLVTACATDMPGQTAPSTASIDQDAGAWRTWVLTSGQQMRLPRPPDAAATAVELQDLRALARHGGRSISE
jgi:hypothetical protein